MFEHLSQWPAIIVTGPQRSGTRIAAAMIAADTGKAYWDEDDWKNFAKPYDHLVELMGRGGVIHGPTLSSACHKLCVSGDTLVVFMMRRLEDILASEARIAWDGEATERAAYLAIHGDYMRAHGLSDLPIAAVSQQIWMQVQCPDMGACALTVEYEELHRHRLWIPKDERKAFAWNQCRPGDLHTEP
jgi:hypothetical protein